MLFKALFAKRELGGDQNLRPSDKFKLVTRKLASAAFVTAAICGSSLATTSNEINYYVVDQPVTAFLSELERSTPLRFQVSENVRGRLFNVGLHGDTDRVMSVISQKLGLDWYKFNGVIHVSSKSESATRVVRLGDLQPEQALLALTESGLPIDSFSAQVTGEGSALALSGPPTFLALAEAVIEAIPETQAEVIAVKMARSIRVRRGTETHLEPIR